MPLKNRKTITLTFWIDTKDILNENRKKHHMAKAVKVANLRGLAAKRGVEWRQANQGADEARAAKDRLSYLENVRAERKLARKYKREANLEALGPEPIAPFVFDRFSVRLYVFPPTKVRLDPPNLYPTLKPLVDGLTDASFWADDNYRYMVETSFRYGGLSGKKDAYKLVLEIYESEPSLSVPVSVGELVNEQ